MTREQFKLEMDNSLAGIKSLFENKNTSYGLDDDVFENFKSTARRLFGDESKDSQARVLMGYVDKHVIALAKERFSGKESRERMKDIIVYMLLMMAMGVGYVDGD